MANKKGSKNTSKPAKKINPEEVKKEKTEKPSEEEIVETAAEETAAEEEIAEEEIVEEKKSAKDKSQKDKSSKTDKSAEKKDKKKRSIKQFFKDIKSEIKKINWSSRQNVIRSTGVVLLVVFLIGIVIWISDFGLTELRQLLYSLAK